MKAFKLFILALLIQNTATYAQSWKLAGNSGTVPGTDFIGTTDSARLIFKLNSQIAGCLDNISSTANTSFGYQSLNVLNPNIGPYNSAFGYRALFSNTTGGYNTALGHSAMYKNISGSNNTATGMYSLFSNTKGSFNAVFGMEALYLDTSGSYNTTMGYRSLYSNRNGNNNTAVGFYSLNSNSSGYSNVAIGTKALYKSYLGHNLVAVGDSALYNQVLGHVIKDIDNGDTIGYAYENTAVGSKSLYSNTSGYDNTATGFQSLYSNKTGAQNTANGYYALYANTGSYNTATGSGALQNNTSGNYNTSDGFFALGSNTSGSDNIAMGTNSLSSNSSGKQNTVIGNYALEINTTGNYNTAMGYKTLDKNTTQYFNTAFGWSAGAFGTSTASTFVGHKASSTVLVDNSIALGYLSTVTASNQVRVGNSSITSVGGQVGWTTLSDGRFKRDINENVPGLEFINKLKPVTYHLNVAGVSKFLKEDRDGSNDKSGDTKDVNQKAISDKEKILYTGFIAQDVEKSAKEINYDFSGVDAPKNDNDYYGLRYDAFIMPLVKSVQQLSAQNDLLQQQVDQLKTIVQSLSQNNSSNITGTNINLNAASLEQNIPNPFNRTTTIRYNIPGKFTTAQLVVTDNSGKTIKQISINSVGKGLMNIDAGSLSSGTYHYSLIVDGKMVDSKSMVVTK